MSSTLLATFCGDGSGWAGQFFERMGMDEKGNFSRGWGWMDMVIFLGDGGG